MKNMSHKNKQLFCCARNSRTYLTLWMLIQKEIKELNLEKFFPVVDLRILLSLYLGIISNRWLVDSRNEYHNCH